MAEWLPIETAPVKPDRATGFNWIDKCLIWVPASWGGTIFVAQMDAGDWLTEVCEPGVYQALECAPTHWQPLPEPPNT